MIAGLPMYDRDETRAANDSLWAAIRDSLRADGMEAPDALTRGGDLWALWRAPDLVLAQTCGYPYRARLHGHVTLLGAFDHRLEGCPPGCYRSVLVARADDARGVDLAAYAGARLAYNEALSQSGWAAVHAHLSAAGLTIGPRVATGAHRASALAVAEGRADIAGLDALSWALMCRYDAFAADLRVIAQTAPTPALPLITARTQPAGKIAAAIETAVAALPARLRRDLGVHGFVRLPAERYLSLANPAEP